MTPSMTSTRPTTGAKINVSDRPARERVLDAYIDLLLDSGERAATLEAVAERAEVSKGGLLYHFASKSDLERGLLERLDALMDEDVHSLEGTALETVENFLRTSNNAGTPLDRALLATVRLAQGSEAAQQALHDVNQRWLTLLRNTVHDEDLARTILLISDGIYYGSALSQVPAAQQLAPTQRDMESAIVVVRQLMQAAEG